MIECAHKELNKQIVGEQVWYACECGQKFHVEKYDGKVTVLEPGAATQRVPVEPNK